MVILALPATFCGIVTMLFITGTTLNVPSLMGAIMAVGVASANSILLSHSRPSSSSKAGVRSARHLTRAAPGSDRC